MFGNVDNNFMNTETSPNLSRFNLRVLVKSQEIATFLLLLVRLDPPLRPVELIVGELTSSFVVGSYHSQLSVTKSLLGSWIPKSLHNAATSWFLLSKKISFVSFFYNFQLK